MGRDPFDVLGLDPAFDLPAGSLQQAFLVKSVATHPDRAATAEERASLEAAAAELNQARQVLSDPEQRAEALLRRVGGAARDADRALPEGFLAEMMATREEIEAATASGDPCQVERWQDWAAARRAAHVRTVASLFKDHASSKDAAVLKQIRVELNVWRYTERLIEQLGASGG